MMSCLQRCKCLSKKSKDTRTPFCLAHAKMGVVRENLVGLAAPGSRGQNDGRVIRKKERRERRILFPYF